VRCGETFDFGGAVRNFVSAVIGTGLGGGVIWMGTVVRAEKDLGRIGARADSYRACGN